MAMPMNYSLRQRLLASAGLILLLFFAAMGFGLNKAFEQSVLSNAQDALRNQILLLISSIDVVDGKAIVPELLAETRLAQPDADLFAQISSPQDQIIWRSKSLLDNQIPELEGGLGDFKFFSEVDWPNKLK